MKVIYPVLKPGDWAGLNYGTVHQVLLSEEDSPTLVLGYGYDNGDEILFVMEHDLEDGGVNELRTQAKKNLDSIEVNFKLVERLKNQVLTVGSDSDFVSEAILSEKHMKQAHELLNTNELLVSIPRRRCMLIARRDSDKEVLEQFALLHEDAWKDDSYGNAPIINVLFWVEDGNIVGNISME